MSEILDDVTESGKNINKKYLLIGAAGVVGIVLFLRWKNPVDSTSSTGTTSTLASGGGAIDPGAVVDPLANVIGQSNQSIITAIGDSNKALATTITDSNTSLINALQTGLAKNDSTASNQALATAITDSNTGLINALQTGLLQAFSKTPESAILTRDMSYPEKVMEHATATLPSGAKIAVDMVDGHTQTALPVGAVVQTGGGNYQITGGSAGNYISNPVKASTSVPKTTAAKTTATTPTGKTVSATIVNGHTQTNLSPGSVVKTNGGNYKITGGTPGHYTSVKVS